MDGTRFDALTRSLVRRQPRRRLLGAAAAATLAAVRPELGLPRAAATGACQAPGQGCKRNDQCCSGRCNKKKRRKRGRCLGSGCPAGHRLCPEGVCRPAGECCLAEKRCDDGSCIPVEECCGGCPSGQTCCPAPRIGICVDLQNDPFHCGLCNRQCPNPTITTTCRSGQCVPL